MLLILMLWPSAQPTSMATLKFPGSILTASRDVFSETRLKAASSHAVIIYNYFLCACMEQDFLYRKL